MVLKAANSRAYKIVTFDTLKKNDDNYIKNINKKIGVKTWELKKL